MTPRRRGMLLWGMLAAGAVSAAPPADRPGGAGGGPAAVVSTDNIELSARHATSWVSPAGEAVMLLRGDFRMQVGRFRAASRDAVVWVRTAVRDDAPEHAVAVYLEGGVSLVHTDGSRTTAERFLVGQVTRGRILRTAETQTERDASGEGVVIRGEVARGGGRTVAPEVGGAARKTAPKTDKAGARPAKRILLGPCDVEVRTRGEETLVVLTGRRTPDGKGPQPVRISYGDVEMIADSMVIFSHRRLIRAAGRDGAAGLPAEAPDDGEGVYLEGDVQINSGRYCLRAARVYYDFGRRAEHPEREPGPERAILVDAVLRAYDEQRRMPLYLRADEVFMRSRTDFAADNAVLTNDDFNPPHFHLSAGRLQLWGLDVQKVPATGQTRLRGFFEAHDAAFKVLDFPVFYLPYLSAENDPRPESFKTLSFGNSSRLGYFGRTEWYLWKLLGLEKPPVEGMEAVLKLDYYGDRGPSIGVDLDWNLERSFGYVRGVYLHDDGFDLPSLFAGPTVPETDERGRLLLRHKQFFDEKPEFGLSRGWEITLELSLLSDRNYLTEFFRGETRNDKEQETVALLKKRGILDHENWAGWLMVQPQINRFLTEVERLPEGGIIGVGEPIGPLVLYSDNRAGSLILRTGGYVDPLTQRPPLAGAPTPVESDPTVRGYTRQEVTLPFSLGPARFQLYTTGRLGVYTDPEFSDDDIGIHRFGLVGLRGLMQFWRVYPDVGSRLLDVHRLRHILTSEFNVWTAGTNVQPGRTIVFDRDIEGTGAVSGAQVALRNLLQTKRGGPGRRVTVDWMWLDWEAGFYSLQHYGFDNGLNLFSDPNNGVYPFVLHPDGIGGIFRGENVWYRPENSRPRDHTRLDFGWRVSDSFQIAADAHWDLDTRPLPLVPITRFTAAGPVITPEPPGRGGPDTWGAGVVADMSPRSKVMLGYRRIEALRADTLTAGLSYTLSDVYAFSFVMQYDIGRNLIVRNRVEVSRRLPRWTLFFRFDFDQVRDDVGFSVGIEPDLGPSGRRY